MEANNCATIMAPRNAVSRALAGASDPMSIDALATATGLRAPVVELCLWQLEQLGLARCNHRGWVETMPKPGLRLPSPYHVGANTYAPRTVELDG